MWSSQSPSDLNSEISLAELQYLQQRGGLWIIASGIGSSVVGFLTFSMLSRLLEPETFGLMAMVSATLSIGYVLVRSGLAEGLVQLPAIDSKHVDTLFWSLQAAGVAVVAGAVSLSGLAERFFRQEGLSFLISIASVVLYVGACAAVPRALLARRMLVAEIAKAEIFGEALGGIVGVSLAYWGGGVWSLIAQQLAARFLEATLLWRGAGYRPGARWSNSRFLVLAQFSAARGMASLLRLIDSETPRFLLGRYYGAAELGRFFFARRLIEMLGETLILGPIRTLGMPTFARLQGDLESALDTYRNGLALTAAIMFPTLALLAVLAPLLIPAAFGPQWATASVLAQLFVIGSFRRPFFIWNGSILRGFGFPGQHLVIALCRSAGVLLFMFALKGYGAPGLALGTALGAYLSWPVGASYVTRLIGLTPWSQLRIASGAILATAVMAAAVYFARAFIAGALQGWAALIPLLAFGAGVYLLVLMRLRPKDVRSLIDLFKGLRRAARSASPTRADV